MCQGNNTNNGCGCDVVIQMQLKRLLKEVIKQG